MKLKEMMVPFSYSVFQKNNEIKLIKISGEHPTAPPPKKTYGMAWDIRIDPIAHSLSSEVDSSVSKFHCMSK